MIRFFVTYKLCPIMIQDKNYPHLQIPTNLEYQPINLANRKRYRSFLKIMLIVINYSLSSFYFGYSLIYLSVIDFGVVMQKYKIDMHRPDAEGLLTFCVPLGGILGAFCSSYFIHHATRRNSILCINYVALILGVLIFFVDFKVYMLLRFGQGICAGIYSAMVPLIIKEIVPLQISGMFGVFHQLFIAFGIFLACIMTYILSVIRNDQSGQTFWYLIFGVPLVTITIQTLCLWTVFRFQTPAYLIAHQSDNQARDVLRQIYLDMYVGQIFEQLKLQKLRRIKISDLQNCQNSVEVKKHYTPKTARFVAIHLAILQQFVGISAVGTYAREIAEGSLPNYKAILPSILNFQQMATCIISSLLLKKFGRKTILLFGTIGFAISNLVIFIGYSIQKEQPELSVTLLMIAFIYFMANFGLSLGPIIWLYIPEIVKPSFLPYSTMTNWAFLALVILLFPIVKARLPNQNPALIFLFFSFWSAISVLINQEFVVETMNKNAAQIDDDYSSKEQKAYQDFSRCQKQEIN